MNNDISKAWFVHFYREFSEWLQVKIKPEYLTSCEKCGRIAVSNPDRLSKEYCKRVGIKFACASCLFPQYENTLKCSMRGNVNLVYGFRFDTKQNKFVPLDIGI